MDPRKACRHHRAAGDAGRRRQRCRGVPPPAHSLSAHLQATGRSTSHSVAASMRHHPRLHWQRVEFKLLALTSVPDPKYVCVGSSLLRSARSVLAPPPSCGACAARQGVPPPPGMACRTRRGNAANRVRRRADLDSTLIAAAAVARIPCRGRAAASLRRLGYQRVDGAPATRMACDSRLARLRRRRLARLRRRLGWRLRWRLGAEGRRHADSDTDSDSHSDTDSDSASPVQEPPHRPVTGCARTGGGRASAASGRAVAPPAPFRRCTRAGPNHHRHRRRQRRRLTATREQLCGLPWADSQCVCGCVWTVTGSDAPYGLLVP